MSLFLLLLAAPARARDPHSSQLPISAQAHSNWFYEPPLADPIVPPPPDRFEILQAGGRPCRIPSQRLPFWIYAGGPAYHRVVERAIETWNQTGLSLGLGYLYRRTDDPSAADIQLNWFDPRLPRDKAAATWWSTGDEQRRVLGISFDGNYPVPEGNRAQVLCHELGHVLGLGESSQVGDVMFYQMDHRRLGLDQLQLSLRDKLALRWLYQQRNFLPILSRRDP